MTREEVLIKLGIDGTSISRGLVAVRDKIKSWATEIRSTINDKLFSGISAAVLIAELHKVGEVANRIRDQAEILGVSTDFVQDIENVARSSGIAGDAVQSMMNKFLKTLPEGVDFREELFKIADRISSTTDPAERLRLAMEAFGKSGAALIPVLSGGRKAVEELAASFTKLSEEDLKSIDEANIQIKNLENTAIVFTGKAIAGFAKLAQEIGKLSIIEPPKWLNLLSFGAAKPIAMAASGIVNMFASKQDFIGDALDEVLDFSPKKNTKPKASTKEELEALDEMAKMTKEIAKTDRDAAFEAANAEEKVNILKAERLSLVESDFKLAGDNLSRARALVEISKKDKEIAAAKRDVEKEKVELSKKQTEEAKKQKAMDAEARDTNAYNRNLAKQTADHELDSILPSIEELANSGWTNRRGRFVSGPFAGAAQEIQYREGLAKENILAGRLDLAQMNFREAKSLRDFLKTEGVIKKEPIDDLIEQQSAGNDLLETIAENTSGLNGE